MSKNTSHKPKRSHKKRLFVVLAVVVLVLAAVGGALWYFLQQKTLDQNQGQSLVSKEVKEQVATGQAKYDEALKGASPEEKRVLYSEKVYLYESAGDYSAAVKLALEVIKLDEANPVAYANAARLAALGQDNATAREYYGKALDANTRVADSETKQLQKQYYEQELAKLGEAK